MFSLKDVKKFAAIFIFLIFTIGCEREPQQIQGYIEARLAFISANYTGVLQQLYVRRGDAVTPGKPLFILEEQPERANYSQAKADLDNAIAVQNEARQEVAHQKILLERREILVRTQALAVEDLDIARINYKNAVAKLDAADAKVNSNKANLEHAAWSKSQKSVDAEQSGTVFDTYFLPSELVPANQPILSLIIPSQIRVIFFVKEPQLSSIKLGQIVYIRCDGYPNLVPTKISFISQRAELTPPVLYTAKERTKFLYRVEADRTTQDLNCFHPGQPVTVVLNKNEKME